MDVRRKRSQVAIVDAAGAQQRNRNLANDPATLVPVLGALPPGTPVAFEAGDGWGWLVDLLAEPGAGAAPGPSQPPSGDRLGPAAGTTRWLRGHPGPAGCG
jgi:hypothetical protein